MRPSTPVIPSTETTVATTSRGAVKRTTSSGSGERGGRAQTKEQLIEEIHRLRDAQKRMLASRARYIDLYDHAPFGYLTLDMRGTILELNFPAATLLGAPKTDAIGLPLANWVDERDAKLFRDHLHRCRTHALQTTTELRLARADHESVPVEMMTLPIYREEGGLFLRSILTDISARRRVEDLAGERRADLMLETKFTALAEMAAGVAHEINNPLTVVLCRATQLKILAQDSKLNSSEALALAERIELSARRIAKVVNALQCIGREGSLDPVESVPVSDLIEMAVGIWRERLSRSRVILKEGSVPVDLAIECRPKRVSQAIWNLISNSFDAVSKRKERWIEIRVETNGAGVVISVSDSGPGIPLQNLDKLFQPFFTTKPVGKGMGLGLIVSRSIAEEHGGTLMLNRRSPATCFNLDLPCIARA